MTLDPWSKIMMSYCAARCLRAELLGDERRAGFWRTMATIYLIEAQAIEEGFDSHAAVHAFAEKMNTRVVHH